MSLYVNENIYLQCKALAPSLRPCLRSYLLLVHPRVRCSASTQPYAAASKMYFDKTADQLLQCIVCGDDTKLHCRRCHKPYCSSSCQRRDWSSGKIGHVGDHKVFCKKLAGNVSLQRLTTPPPRPPTPPSQAGRRGDFETPAAQPVSSFKLCLWPPFVIDSKARADGATKVYIAAEDGDTDAVRALHAAGCDVNLADNEGMAPVYVAAIRGHMSVVEALVAARCDVNLATSRGDTPLMAAVYYDHYDIVVALLKHGADAALATTEADGDVAAGSTALQVARQFGRGAMVELLTKRRRRRRGGKSGSSTR